jgi:predicted SprT family Zn-dependent metalloprotease
MKRKRDNKWLKKHFDMFNREYFDNTITCCRIRFGIVGKKSDGHFAPEESEIVISKEMNGHDMIVFMIMLHEMAHRKLWQEGYRGGMFTNDPFHGGRWHAEIDRLYKMGAYEGLL